MTNDDRAAMRGGHATIKGALGAYRRRQQAGDRILAGHGFPVRTDQPARDPNAPRPNPDFGGGAMRGRTPANPPPSMNDILRGLSRPRGY